MYGFARPLLFRQDAETAHGLGLKALDVAYRTTHRLRGRGYLREERRKYALSEQGQELVAMLDAEHREGIQAYIDQLDPDERQRLHRAFADARLIPST